MIIAGLYSFNGGKEAIENNYPTLFAEVCSVINQVNAGEHKTKESDEKTMKGKLLYSPSSLNTAFKERFSAIGGWKPYKEKCDYPTEFYTDAYKIPNHRKKIHPYREMDFVKNNLGVEVQFGKYAFMVYNVCAKMTIFNKLGVINAGIEIVPIKSLADEMSTGVSYFEQFVWDLQHRGISNIDIPVYIIGIDV